MYEFDLRALVREVVETSDSPDPADIAKEVNHRIGRADRDAALEQSLRVYVQNYLSRTRYDRDMTTAPGGQMNGDTQVSTAAGRGSSGQSSSKVTGIREWARMLRKPIALGTQSGAPWKFLGDLNAEDCRVVAKIREDTARRNAARAKQFNELGELITEFGVTKISELPDETLARILGGDAS
jgi:hypothetical protein